MQLIYLTSVLLGLWGLSVRSHAEGNCPSGFYPVGGGSAGWTGCAPIPGAQQQQQSLPSGPVWADRWGAIATDASRGILGGVTGMTSERVAKQAALDDCKAKGGVTCKFDTSYVNGCTAVIASDTNYFVGLDPSLKKTVLDGLQTCNDKGRKKRSTLYSACSPPVRVH